MDEDRVLLEARPSWWNFFWHIVFCWLIIPLIVAFWKKASLVLRVYGDRVVLETGVLSKSSVAVFCADIRAVNIRQDLVQRIVGIGDIGITAAGDAAEQVAFGLPNPKGIKELIMKQKRAGGRSEN